MRRLPLMSADFRFVAARLIVADAIPFSTAARLPK
jgi:hypothetical protein